MEDKTGLRADKQSECGQRKANKSQIEFVEGQLRRVYFAGSSPPATVIAMPIAWYPLST